MNAVRVFISPMLLVEAMRFPEGTELTSAEMTPDGYHVLVTLEHPSLPSVADGETPKLAIPTFQRNYDRTEPSVDFLGWGIK